MTDYELVLRGEIGDRFAMFFEDMRLERVDGRTLLTGDVRDQAQLLGVIERIQELGLELVSVNPKE
jgi:hypothetical protein